MHKLIELEKKLHNSTNRQNSHFLKEILHADFFEFGRSGGTSDKRDTLLSLANEMETSIYSENYHCSFLSENTVLMTYTSFELHHGKKNQTHPPFIYLAKKFRKSMAVAVSSRNPDITLY